MCHALCIGRARRRGKSAVCHLTAMFSFQCLSPHWQMALRVKMAETAIQKALAIVVEWKRKHYSQAEKNSNIFSKNVSVSACFQTLWAALHITAVE